MLTGKLNNREAFTVWISKQKQKSNTSKLYSEESKKAFIRCVERGLIRAANLDETSANLFLVDDADTVENIAKKYYMQIISYDKRNQNSDLKLGIEFYIKFLKEKNAVSYMNNAEETRTKIKNLIAAYKANFAKINEEELYKWEAVGEYKRFWSRFYTKNIASTIKKSFGKAYNLLQSSYYYPLKMLCEYAEQSPETVWELFTELHREEFDFGIRYMNFKSSMDSYFKSKNLNSYQDLHAVSVYLSFEYPEKYFIYKYSILTGMNKLLNITEEKIDSMTDVQKYGIYCDICNLILHEIYDDTELQKMHFNRLTKTCYKDEQFHLLAMDIAYFGSRNAGWWPSLEEYNPNLSKDDWKKYILEIEKPNHPSPMKMLKGMMELGGEVSCKKLASVYGGTPSSYVGCTMNLGRRVKKYFDLPPCMDGDQERYFPFPFLGKAFDDKDGHQYIYKIRPELFEALKEIDLSDISPYYEEDDNMNSTDISKNTILYGPPGTGKTYNTVCYAVAIIENKPLEEVMSEAADEYGYAEVFERYNNYKNQGLIAFTTFHQSYGYEEFIEGIKPVMEFDDDEQADIKYTVADGVFKEFCENANVVSGTEKSDIGLNSSPSVWKVSLWSTGDNPVRTECLENGHIRIGWDCYGPDITEETDFSENGGRNVLNSFLYKMKIGDIILSCYSNTSVDAVGVVTGEYEWNGNYDDLNRVRKVNWLVKGIDENIVEINNNTVFTLSTVYKTKISVADALAIVEKHSDVFKKNTTEQKNKVFIIDEINRGNISKIFGELITLIEPSKRLGAKEGIKAILPYSKKAFGIPDNVYILGTMNTADRSIATLDTALRRRFDFVEMMPDENVLSGIDVDGIDISRMLGKINERISVLFDREHTIGHAYFIGLKDNDTIDALSNIFRNKVIPLLQEYFYEDYEKIRLVLADNQVQDEDRQFVVAKEVKVNELFGTNDVDIIDDTKRYLINNNAFENKEAYIKIYSK